MDALDRAVAAALLEEYSERLSCNGCNDTDARRFGLTEKEWRSFKLRVNRAARESGEFDVTDDEMPTDWMVADYIQRRLELENE